MKRTSKAWRRWLAGALCMAMLFAASAFAEEGRTSGYSVHSDGIALSKTLKATDWENLFEMTLGVRVQKTIAEWLYGNTAVVIVLDISNTMNSAYTGRTGEETRIASAKAAAQKFAAQFLSDEYEELGVQRQLGFVTFNTNAHAVIPLMTQQELSDRGGAYVQDTIGAVVAPGSTDPDRYTNIEGGLRLAHNMLDQSGAMFKHVILLTDGFPTTYADTSGDMTSLTAISGYATHGNEERFFNRKLGLPCPHGTDYSDEGATRAQNEAASIRADGIYLHTVGVDIGGQTIQQKLDAHAGKDFSTVDCYAEGDYVIGSAASVDAYRGWLAGSISGEGTTSAHAGRYASCDNAAELDAIYDELFKIIREVSTESTEGLWVATDTMGEKIELRGFVQEYPTVSETDDGFQWNILETKPTERTEGNVTYYDYEVKYYVRLTNEADGFGEEAQWPTNGPTWFDYRVVETVGGQETFSETRRAEFDVPSVEGYLSELAFVKKDAVTGEGVEGAGFTLTHDADDCEICRNIEALTRDQGDTQIGPFYAESDAAGKVAFAQLPSGHEYVLKETKTPAGYQHDDSRHDVGIHYDVISENDFSLNGVINHRYNSLTVSKTVDAEGGWDDPNFTPVFTVQLQKLNEAAGAYDALQTTTLRADESHTFTQLLAGTYRIVELEPDAHPSDGWEYEDVVIYTIGPDDTETVGGSVTLYSGDEAHVRVVNRYRYTPNMTELTAYKRWNDDEDRDGKRPQSVRFALLVNGMLWKEDGVKDVTVQESDNLYSVQFSYDGRRGEPSIVEIGYTDSMGKYHAFGTFDENGFYVPSAEVPFGNLDYTVEYAADESGRPVVINTHVPETVSVRIWKTWDNVADQHIKPVTVRLYADGVEISSVVLDGSEGWYHVFTHTAAGQPLHKYHNGREIVYHVTEDELGGGYVSEVHPMPGDPYGWLLVNTYHMLPLTGDDTKLWLLMALAALSLGGLVVLMAGRKRRTSGK